MCTRSVRLGQKFPSHMEAEVRRSIHGQPAGPKPGGGDVEMGERDGAEYDAVAAGLDNAAWTEEQDAATVRLLAQGVRLRPSMQAGSEAT
jgi:hypothetical protein